MFDWVKAISIDPHAGTAAGRATLAADGPLFADHFPDHPIAPATILLEIAAQIAGPLAEESHPEHPLALLTMVRSARFDRPVALPADVEVSATLNRTDASSAAVMVSLTCGGHRVARAELVFALAPAEPSWAPAIAARSERLETWKEAF